MNDLEPQEKKCEAERPVPEVQGFNLSQDYELLWKLICNGYRVPGWVRYTDRFLPDLVWYDIVEIKKYSPEKNDYQIGSRGVGYGGYYGQKDVDMLKFFSDNCKAFNVWYAMPNYKIPLL